MGYSGFATWPWLAFNARSATRALIFATAGALACTASSAFAQTAASTDEAVTRAENAAHCDLVARGVIRDLEQRGRRPSARLTAFKATVFGANMRGIREVAQAGASRRSAADTRAGVDAIREQGEAALHAELRRCWTLFSEQPVPDDLI